MKAISTLRLVKREKFNLLKSYPREKWGSTHNGFFERKKIEPLEANTKSI